MKIATAFLFATALCAQAPTIIRGSWAPQLTHDETTGRDYEGLWFHFSEWDEMPTVTIESNAGSVTGKPDRFGFLKAPIGNLDTYKLRRLVIDHGDSQWILENPKQAFELSTAVAVR